jgi:hypothetical protein
MKTNPTRLAALLPLLLLCSCAHLFHRDVSKVSIDSDPPGAEVVHNRRVVGKTPCVVKMPREKLPILTLRIDGHHEQHVELANDPAPVGLVVLDCLILLPVFIDVAAKADFAVDETPVKVTLAPTSGPPPRIWRRADFDPTAPKPATSGGVVVVPR